MLLDKLPPARPRRFVWILLLAVWAGLSPCARAAPKAWTGGAGDWFVDSHWSPVGVPANGDSVRLDDPAAVVLLAHETALLGSFDMTAGRLVFSNWTTRLTATNTTISGGTITVANAFGDADMSNRVWIVCAGDLTLAAPGRIDVDGGGYASQSGPGIVEPVVSDGSDYGGGGGHGGRGGAGTHMGGRPNDNPFAPSIPGTGGHNDLGGGWGGGAVRIEAGGTAALRGTITANGLTGLNTRSGGGAGGAIWITCGLLTGDANGLLRANGGAGNLATVAGGGGGGRIAIEGLVGAPFSIRMETSPGHGAGGSAVESPRWPYRADWGSLYFQDTNVFTMIPMNGQISNVVLYVDDRAEWLAADLMVTRSRFRFGATNFLLNVAGDLVVDADGHLGLEGTLQCGGNLTLTNGGKLSIFSTGTNVSNPRYGGLLDVAGAVRIAGNDSWLLPFCHPTNGGPILLRMASLDVSSSGTNGGINASGCGLGACMGPGRGWKNTESYGGGGGHGGRGCEGRTSDKPGGGVYGSSNAPILPGSGGSSFRGGGYGGGVIWIETEGDITLNGTLKADGDPGWASKMDAAGGGGGAILVACNRFAGTAAAVVSARGGNPGNSLAGGGGGGRIAVWHNRIPPSIRERILNGGLPSRPIRKTQHPDFQGTLSVANGNPGYYSSPDPRAAYPGTTVFLSSDQCMILTLY